MLSRYRSRSIGIIAIVPHANVLSQDELNSLISILSLSLARTEGPVNVPEHQVVRNGATQLAQWLLKFRDRQCSCLDLAISFETLSAYGEECRQGRLSVSTSVSTMKP